MGIGESAVGFFKTGGHSHDGKDSSKIDFSKYDDDDLKDLYVKFRTRLVSGEDDDASAADAPIAEDVPISSYVAEVTNLSLTTGQNVNGTSWIRASWDQPTDTAADDGTVDTLSSDDGDGDYTGEVEDTAPVYFEGSVESPDDTDLVDVTPVETQSNDSTIEYQVSYGRTSEWGDTTKRTFFTTDLTDVQIRGLTSGVNYTVRVRGVNRIGVKSDAVDDTITTGTNSTTPDPPTSLSATMGYQSATLEWLAPAAPTHAMGGTVAYELQYDDNASFTSPSSLYAAALTISITTLSHATQYWFRVRTISATGIVSSWSSSANGTTTTIPTGGTTDGSPPASSPSLATSGSVVGGPQYFRVKWAEVSNHDTVYYEVHMSTSSGFTPTAGDTATLAATTPGLSVFIQKLPGGGDVAYGVNYYFRIIATDYDGAASPGTVSAATQASKLDGTDDIVAASITAASLAAISLEVGQEIESSSYATGVSGWHIDGDGTAEFSDVTVRGQIVGNSITGNVSNDVAVNGSFDSNITGWGNASFGVLSYDGTTGSVSPGSLKFDPDTGASAAGLDGVYFVSDDPILCEPNSCWTGSLAAKSSVSGGDVYLGLAWYSDASGTTLISQNYLSWTVSTTTSWQNSATIASLFGDGVYAVAPATAKSFRIICYIDVDSDSTNYFIDDIEVFQLPLMQGLVIGAGQPFVRTFSTADSLEAPGGIIISLTYSTSNIANITTETTLSGIDVSTPGIFFEKGRYYRITGEFGKFVINAADDAATQKIKVDGSTIKESTVAAKTTNENFTGFIQAIYLATASGRLDVAHTMTGVDNGGGGNVGITAGTGRIITVEDIGGGNITRG